MNQISNTLNIRAMKRLAGLCLLLLMSCPVFANVYNVTQTSDGHAVNQLRGALEAADAAGPGPHTINVPAGTYNLTLGEISFGNSAQTISIIGAGASSTIINMTSTLQDRIFYINPPGTIAGVNTIITGIKFTNGHLTSDVYGGGALICGGPGNSMIISNCAFEGNSTPAGGYAGGAINMQGGGTISIDQCTFTNNNANSMTGGAVQVVLTNLPNLTGSVSITNSTFTGNSNTSTFAPGGGAIGIVSSQGVSGQSFSTTIQKNTFVNNFVPAITDAGGGAIFIQSGHQVNINYNRFYNNKVGTVRDALQVMKYQAANTDATNNWWGSNEDPGVSVTNSDKAYLTGAGSGSLTISPRLQLKTTSASAVLCQSGGNTGISADFLLNSAGSSVSTSNLARLIGLPVSLTAANGNLSNVQTSIQSNGKATATFSSNGTTGSSSVTAVLDNIPAGDATARATLTVEGTPTFTAQPTGQQSCGGSTISFSATATSVSGLSYHWFKGSTSLNNGATGTGSTLSGVSTNTLTITNPGASDIASNYKCVATNSCGSTNSNSVSAAYFGSRLYVAPGGSGAGNSWATALGDLSAALTIASSCSAVTEIWVKTGTYVPTAKAYGQTTSFNRDLAFYLLNGVTICGGFAGTETSLSQRNISANPTVLSGDIGTVNDASDNCYHVVVSVGNNSTAILDGFTITGGKADLASSNTIIGTQTARYHGGGITLMSSSARIRNCSINSNTAMAGGGGLFQSAGNVLVSACSFSGNSGQYGGAIRNEGNPVLNVRNSVFRNNISSASGAGMSLYLGADTLVNNLFIRNKDNGTTQGGGSLCVATGDFYIVNNTFYADTSAGHGGALRIETNSGTCKVFNNVFYKTYGAQGNNDVNNALTGYVQSNNSFSTANPSFTNENDFDGVDNIYGTSDDGLKLNIGSIAINAGDNSKIPSGITTDITGAARIQDVTADAGCYENVAGTAVTYYRDADGDTYGDAGNDTVAYIPVTGFVADNTDCNDADASVHAPQQYYVDADGDGFGSTTGAMLCAATAPSGYSANNTDCSDADALVHAPQQYYVDADGDGYGSSAGALLCAAAAPAGYSANNTDCNDADASIHAPLQYYVDADGDGYGSTTTAMLCSNTAPAGYTTDNTDCNDADASIHEPQPYFPDLDGDGYGSGYTEFLCTSTPPAGYSANSSDCNDGNAAIYPGAPEICGNGVDENCNGMADDACIASCTKAPARPGNITIAESDPKVCPGEMKAFIVAPVPNTDSYVWTVPAGATILFGQGTPQILVAFDAAFVDSSSITVAAVNTCGTSPVRYKALRTGTIPATPGAISGSFTDLCNASSVTYYVPHKSGVSYTWSFSNPAAATITSGWGFSQIEATFDTFQAPIVISVTATNGCGTSAPRQKTLQGRPTLPATPAGPALVCSGTTGVSYSVTVAASAVSYTWAAPPGAHISDGTTTSIGNSLTTTATTVFVNFGTASGNVKVRVNNGCGSSAYASLPVTVGCTGSSKSIAEAVPAHGLQLCPNPAHDNIHLNYYAEQAGSYSLFVMDALGKMVINKEVPAAEGNNRIDLDISTLTPGVYQLVLSAGKDAGSDFKQTARFVVE